MAKYSNLKFFDSNSDELNLTYDSTEETWQGIVYLPEVSTGLYETLTVYILQETIGSLGETKYVTPLAEASSTNDNIQVSFQNEYDSSENIILYSSTMEDGELYIKTDKSQLKTRLATGTSTSEDGDGFRIVSSSLKSEPIQINVALKSDEETYHKRTLLINEINAAGTIVDNIATIRVYGETVGEDERLETLLSNIGMSLSPTDHFVFEDADIRESSPDWKLINRKRRELLLEAANIKPFIGTYKALLNAIKYFGYENITLTEYWLNINETAENFGKLKAVAIPNQDVKGFLAAKNSTSQLPNSNLKKTSRFSLVYRLNNATGEYDEWDIPKVKEALDFSPDEVLIKLYGLKNRLQKSYIPMQAKIVDIVGEGDYFSQFNINTWNNQQNISTVNEGIDVGYEVFPDRGLYLEDLRKVSPYLTGKGQDFEELENGVELLKNGNFSATGDELVTDGSFPNGTSSWNIQGSSTLSDGYATVVGMGTLSSSGNNWAVFQTISSTLSAAKAYKVTFTAKKTAGTGKLHSGLMYSQPFSQVITSDFVTYTYYQPLYTVGGSYDKINFGGEVGSTFEIKDVSVKELGADWTLGTGWSIGDSKAVCDGTQVSNSNLYQVVYTISNSYKTTLDVIVTAGTLYVYTGTPSQTITITSSGTYDFSGLSSSSTTLYIQAQSDFVGSITNVSIKELATIWPTTKASIESFYGVYEETDMSTFSDLDIPVGCPIILKANSFKDTWEDCEATYDDANDGMDITHGILAAGSLPTSANSEIGQLVLQNTSGVYAQLYFDGTNWIPFTNGFTWDKWWHRNIYEIEWRLIGPNGYDRTFRGPISNDVDDANPSNTPNPKGYREFLLTLPYTGKYSVELAFYDLYNVRSVKFDKDAIEVKSKEVETYGITQSKSPVLNWNGYHKYLWSTAGADWDTAAENTFEVQDFVGSYYLTLDRANYMNSDNNWQHSTVVRQEDTTSTSGFSETAGPYTYKNMKKHDWNDGETMSWDMMRVGSDMLAAFKINFTYGGSGQPPDTNHKNRIVATAGGVTDAYTVLNYPNSITDITKWTLVETELNALTSTANPWLSQFTYNLVIEDTNADGDIADQGTDTCKYILAVAKKDFTTFQSVVDANGITPHQIYHRVAVTHHNLHSSYNPSYVDTKVINQHDIYNKLNHFTFSFDNSKVPGIKTHEWSIKNNNKKITDIYYNNRWLTYVFDEKGDYTIGLKLTDVNGNKMETTKNILTIK